MSTSSLLALALAGLLLVTFPSTRAHKCQPNGTLESPATGHTCDECCKPGHLYPTYRCSPPVSKHTKAVMTLNDFSKGGDGGAPSECDGKYHNNTERVVALSTGWYANGKRSGRKCCGRPWLTYPPDYPPLVVVLIFVRLSSVAV
ncbi:unnamed protein product [Urochloa humidicola]